MTFNPYAIYVNCDGAMDYDSKSSGGIGYVINFPESMQLESISNSIGKYIGANIERLELEAIIQGMEEILRISKIYNEQFRKVTQIIFLTDRCKLNDKDKTNPYLIKEWRRNNWHSHEGNPIKNSDLIDRLDKTRKKIYDTLHCRINIEYQRRNKNKAANKLAKAGKEESVVKNDIAIKGAKISRRIYTGTSVNYKQIRDKEEYIIHIYRKEPVRKQWEIFSEICVGKHLGRIMRIYTDDILASKLHRQHVYKVRIKSVQRYCVHIYRTFNEIKNKIEIISSINE